MTNREWRAYLAAGAARMAELDRIIGPDGWGKPSGSAKQERLDAVAAKMRAKYWPETQRKRESAAHMRKFRWLPRESSPSYNPTIDRRAD